MQQESPQTSTIGVKPLSLLALFLGLLTATTCLISLSLLIGQVDNIREELTQEMFVFRQETDEIWSVMITNSGRVKRQGYDFPAAPPAAYGSAPSSYEAATSPPQLNSYGQASNGYDAAPQRPAVGGYDASPQGPASNGYESPTSRGPIPAGQRSGAFQPAAYPPSALFCQCSQIDCPPGPPGDDGEDGYDGEEGSDGEPGDHAQDAPAQIQQYDKCFHCPAGLPGPQDNRDGAPGFPGSLGPDGPQGERGMDGVQGVPGEDTKHIIGSKGPKGEPGPIGDAGERGPQGPPGGIGPRGEQGDPGKAGENGKNGEMGANGESGDFGLPGSDAAYCPCPTRSALNAIASQPPQKRQEAEPLPVLRPGAIVSQNPYRRMMRVA